MSQKHKFNDAAIDALIAAAILPDFIDGPPSEETILYFIEQAEAATPTPEDEVMFRRIEARLQAAIAGEASPPERSSMAALSVFSMNRKSADDSFCTETQQGLDEARQAALDALRKQQEEQQ